MDSQSNLRIAEAFKDNWKSSLISATFFTCFKGNMALGVLLLPTDFRNPLFGRRIINETGLWVSLLHADKTKAKSRQEGESGETRLDLKTVQEFWDSEK